MTRQKREYSDIPAIEEAVAAGAHRELVGGMWDEIGRLQLDVMVAGGLRPHHRLLDVGCGSLRGGVHFVPYLDPGNYFGIDLNRSLIDAGYEREILPLGLAARLPRKNLIATADFDVSAFNVPFDRAIALSVFTHLSLNRIRTCLERLHPAMAEGGAFYATFFEAGRGTTSEPVVHRPGGITTFGDADPYHYRPADLRFAAAGLPWEPVHIGDFGHPRDQRLMLFCKTG